MQQRRTYVDKNGKARRYPETAVQRNGQRNGQRSPQPRPSQAKKQSSGREWVYPEGYRPPARKAPQPRKAPPKKKPKQDYGFLWVFLGELALRLGIGVLVGCAVIGLMYRSKFYGVPEDDRKDMTYVLSETVEEKEVKTTFEASAQTAYHDGNLMVNFSDVAAWLDMAQVGDIYTMRFVVRGEDEASVVFHYSSHSAFIGHEIIVMDGRTRFDNGEVWVPLSFVQSYMKGFDVAVEGETVRLSRNGDAVGFGVMSSEPISPCEYPTGG